MIIPSWQLTMSVLGSSWALRGHYCVIFLHCTMIHCTALHCTTLHYTTLYCTALNWPALISSAGHPTALCCTAPPPWRYSGDLKQGQCWVSLRNLATVCSLGFYCTTDCMIQNTLVKFEVVLYYELYDTKCCSAVWVCIVLEIRLYKTL